MYLHLEHSVENCKSRGREVEKALIYCVDALWTLLLDRILELVLASIQSHYLTVNCYC